MVVLRRLLLRRGRGTNPDTHTISAVGSRSFLGRCLIAVLAATGLAGCSDPGTIRVVGRITYNGEPVADAVVGFYSDYRDDRPAAGRTDADGRYELKTYISSTVALKGAFPNKYGVVVFKFRRPFPERVDAELARRFAPIPGQFDAVEIEAEGALLEGPVPVHHLSPGFKFPPATDVASLREMLSLTNRQLRGLSSEELKQLRFPPDWVRLGMNEEMNKLSLERDMGKSFLPMRYFDEKTSGLHASVERGEREPLVFDFELTDEELTDEE